MTNIQLNNALATVKAVFPTANLGLVAVGLGAKSANTEDGKILNIVMPNNHMFCFPL
jgi:hypothetical protein